MDRLSQSPTEPGFVQDPYPFYDRVRAAGPVVFWEEYGLPVTAHAAVVSAAMRDRRLGRAAPEGFAPAIPERLRPFYDIDDHSMLELDGPTHARLRGLVLRAFTLRRIAGLAPEIATLCDRLIAALPEGEFDLIAAIAQPLPVIVIARLLGVPEAAAPELLSWSNAMVGMYQAKRDRAIEDRACAAAEAFAAFLRGEIAKKRRTPGDDLLSALIAAEEDGAKLSEPEMVATAILLLNAGHEATVHTLGNAVKAVLESGARGASTEGLVEEVLRYDPPLHLFTRWVQEACEIGGVAFARGQQIGCLLGGANRDPAVWEAPGTFRPDRVVKANYAFGIGPHFCLGAPLARMELGIALERIFAAMPGLRIVETPVYADLYHFHGLERLMLAR